MFGFYQLAYNLNLLDKFKFHYLKFRNNEVIIISTKRARRTRLSQKTSLNQNIQSVVQFSDPLLYRVFY